MSTTERATHYAVLSAEDGWSGVRLDGLDVRSDGRIELHRVPAVAPAVVREPGPAPRSGLALDDRCGLYLSDTNEVVRIALDCRDRTVVASTSLQSPAGVCLDGSGLVVADPGRGAVLVFATRSPYPLIRAWDDGLVAPVEVAPDDAGGLYVLDADGGGRVVRLDRDGQPDAAFAARLAAVRPTAIAAADDGTLYVGDRATGSVSTVDGPLFQDVLPSALAVAGDVLYVADETTGTVHMVSRVDGRRRGTVEGFRGPVSALAVARDGRVYLRMDEGYLVAEPGAGCVPLGRLEAGPLDAGEDSRWSRVAVRADADVVLATYSSVDSGAVPVWLPAPATDLLVDGERFLWLRLTLEADRASGSPVLAEIRADTGGDGYLEHLPRVYARSDADGFLGRLLELARSVLGDLEDDIGSLPRRFDPATTPAEALVWLAGWLAFDPPPVRDEDIRALLDELPELYRTRGTPDGLARLVAATTGVRPALFERFRERRTWMLGTASALGVDTALAPSAPDGLVVGTSTVGTSVPESPDEWGRAVFGDIAHRFTAVVPAGSLTERERLRVREVLEAEKPAHTRMHLCLAGPAFRVGVQATIGIDAIVAAAPVEGFVLERRPVLASPQRRSTYD